MASNSNRGGARPKSRDGRRLQGNSRSYRRETVGRDETGSDSFRIEATSEEADNSNSRTRFRGDRPIYYHRGKRFRGSPDTHEYRGYRNPNDDASWKRSGHLERQSPTCRNQPGGRNFPDKFNSFDSYRGRRNWSKGPRTGKREYLDQEVPLESWKSTQKSEKQTNQVEHSRSRQKSGSTSARVITQTFFRRPGKAALHRNVEKSGDSWKEDYKRLHSFSSAENDGESPDMTFVDSHSDVSGNQLKLEENQQPSAQSPRKPQVFKRNLKTPPFSDQELQSFLEGKPSEVLKKLIAGQKKLLALLNLDELTADTVILLVRVLSCMWYLDPVSEALYSQELNTVLSLIESSSFLSKHLTRYLAGLTTRQPEDLDDNDANDVQSLSCDVKMIFELLQLFLQHKPTRYSDVGVPLILLQKVVTTTALNNTAFDPESSLMTQVQQLSECCNSLEQGQKRARQRATEKPPPNNFRDIPVFPETTEIRQTAKPFLRKNITHGRYESVEHYLDVQFRLLREDFLAPLREGVTEYLAYTTGRLQDIRLYYNVFIEKQKLGNSGVTDTLKFEMRNRNRRPERWEKRLLYGSFVCLSNDEFQHILCATVENRNPNDLANGFVDVRFLTKTSRALAGPFIMAESTAYFEAYRHVLQGLQKTNDDNFPFKKYIVDVASIVDPPVYLRDDDSVTYDLRSLLVDTEEAFDYDRKVKSYVKAAYVPIFYPESWPTAEELHLDESQTTALQTALTNEFSVIQGPPGTGKTFIGLKIIQILLDNSHLHGEKDKSPILVVCYTNHALDQFLEGIIGFGEEKVVRVGGRSSSEVLESKNLKSLKRERVHVPDGFGEIKSELKLVRELLQETEQTIQWILTTLNLCRKVILDVVVLRDYMRVSHYETLTRQRPRGQNAKEDPTTHLLKWLKVDYSTNKNDGGSIPSQANESPPEGESHDRTAINVDVLQQEYHPDVVGVASENDDNPSSDQNQESEDSDDQVRIEVEDEGYAIQQERQIVNTYDLNISLESNQSLEEEFFHECAALCVKLALDSTSAAELQKDETMTDQEAKGVKNIWSLNIQDRWRLYRLWVKKFKGENEVELNENYKRYETLINDMAEISEEEDLAILREANVIGMTTTGAARWRSVLQLLGPRIVVVEEAAEVLEAHIVTTLTAKCQHLILIGDHQQLKPNPTVYRLAKLFKLDTSLFERMINNGVPCKSLTHQHRMRPEISNLMKKHFYEKLQDDESVFNRDNIKGVQRNMFFIDHQQLEDGVDDNRTRSNQYEAKVLVELCRYLLRQGYKPSQITILTTYTGQLFCFRRLMDRATFEGVRVCVVDNFQGEENDIILLSLVRSNEEGSIGFLRTTNRVCVALSRARMGFYCIGNATILKKAKIWQGIMSTLEAQHQIGSSLPLVCQNHPDKVTHVSTAKDFTEKVPSGGCDRPCGYVLSCGHVCTLFCHPCDTHHEGYRCQKPCKRLCRRGEHLCPLQCHQPCPTFCKMEVPKLIDNCGHEIQVFCYKFDSVTCPLPCTRGFTSCHHRCRRQCGETCPQTCPEKCERKLACGHSCTKQCGGPCNLYCSVQVKKTLPKCGHSVDMDCSGTGVSCPEPCPRVFDACHHRCRLKCGQNCRKTCPEKCEKKLTCGHPCTELCGNHCTRYCAVQVGKALPSCGHKMNMDCSKNAEVVKCQKWVRKTHPKCGHDVLVSCSEDLKEVRCKTFVMKDRTICGHRIRMPCYTDANSIECKERCPKTLGCGHQCPNMCGKPCEVSDISSTSPVSFPNATDNFKLCKEIVEKSYPSCEHVIKLPCHQEVSLVPCSNMCGRLLSCGHRCPRKCTEPCPVEKPSGLPAMIYIKYTTFSEFCTDKCEKFLSCGHPCPNKCGEPCPDTNFTAVGLAVRTRYRLMFSTECEVLLDKKLPNCSHIVKTKCSQDIASLSCPENCNKELPCSHYCTGKCSEPCKCRQKVAKRLPICGHVAQLPCSQDASSYVCDKKCEKELTCGHQCPNKCGDPCPGEELALSKVPLTSTTSTKTSVHVSSASEQCKELVEKKLPSCGHVQAIPCYQDVGSAICFKNCEKVLSCGHRCPNICGEPCPEETSSSSVGTRSSQRYGRFNRCEEIVAKVLSCGHVKDVACWQDVSSTDCWKQCTAVLSCGHTCGGDCGRCEQGTEHVPCTDLCERQLLCGHMCNKKCSTVCSLDCWRCEKTARKEHGYSWRYRGEAEMLKLVPCKHNIRHRQLNTNACILPCRLPNPYCGHTCIGVCGEPCPPFCLECSRWEVTEKLPKGGIRPRQTFIYLPDCRHLCETRFLDGIVATVQSLLESGFFIIRPLLCPKCKEPIRNCPRYKDLLETICHCVDSAKQQCNERKIVAFGRSHGCQEYSSTGAEVTAGLKPFVVGKWIRCPHGHVFYHNGDDKQSVLQCDLRCPDCLE